MSPTRHLAQLNIGRFRYPTDDPRMAGFMNALDLVNGLAERSEGFVWQLKDDSGNATSFRPFPDPQMAVNLSVWESVKALERLEHLKANGPSDHAFGWAQASTSQIWKTARCASDEHAA